jgi:16S rRNA (guanine1207-N2)-methyltransferase
MSGEGRYTACVLGTEFTVFSSPGLFSPSGLDTGTRLLLETAGIRSGMKVLDLGCGCGPVGLFAASVGADVTMSDSDPAAIEACRKGLSFNQLRARLFLSDGFENIPDAGYDLILTNPPYHTDYAVAKRFIEKGFNRLKIGGRMALVVKRSIWYENKLRSIFGGTQKTQRDGYTVLIAEKRSENYAGKQSRKKQG